jgi:predicted  nucleic acid-binding Zn-ribbon protein
MFGKIFCTMKSTVLKILLGLFVFSCIFTSCFKDDLLKEIDTLRTTITTMQRRSDSLNNLLNLRSDSLVKALTNVQKRSDSLSNVLKNKSDSLSKALGITNANLLAVSKSVDSIKLQITFINGQLTTLNTQLTSITSQLTQLNKQLTTLSGDVSTLATQYQALSDSLQTINTQIAALQADQLKLLEKLNAILLQLNPPVDITTGLVAYYPFSGNAGDSSGNGNHGTVNGATLTTDRFGNNNKAYSFDGVSNYIRCLQPGPTGNPTISVSFWIKSGQSNYGQIIGYGSDGQNGKDFRIYMSPDCGMGNISFDTYGNVNSFTDNHSIDNWDNYVVIYDGTLGSNVTSSKIYKNGILLTNNCRVTNKTITNIESIIPITFGKYQGTVQNGYFNGKLDDIRVYNRVLTQSEITYLATH